MPLTGMYRVSAGHVPVSQIFRRAALEGLGRAASDYQGEGGYGRHNEGGPRRVDEDVPRQSSREAGRLRLQRRGWISG